ncbi:helix-turn-helix transcriptional regulator [Arcobacter porcinus]|uniref:Transcriptional regulator, AlpA family n=1 Tax=Arcobacter porcinus TaxID=1935204 RepID=A0A5C2HDY7_9BACT|nr:AlpA family phage regulatory protein [Arcobacter porcinus]OCL89455.1 Prophage CP4-57 regulatory protein (AlpA) [Aliarcobacter thereius]QEP41059.1 hypothetical protein APORC_1476 [Arcobacter porcinus]
MGEKLLRKPQVIEITGIAGSTIYAKMKQLRFPSQHKYGGTACWKLSEVQEYIKIGEEEYSKKIKEKINVSK